MAKKKIPQGIQSKMNKFLKKNGSGLRQNESTYKLVADVLIKKGHRLVGNNAHVREFVLNNWHHIERELEAKNVTFLISTKKQNKSIEYKKKAIQFYQSREWLELRYKALVKYGAACQLCGACRETGAVIHVDHIKPRSKYPDLELCLDNLQILCQECNLGKSNKDETDWRQSDKKTKLKLVK